MKKLVLIVDDSTEVATSLAMAIERLDHLETCTASHPSSALRMFDAPAFHICALITDLNLPSIDGLRLIREIRKRSGNPVLPAILVTGQENVGGQENPNDLNRDTLSTPNVIFHKPFAIAEVCRVLQSLLE